MTERIRVGTYSKLWVPNGKSNVAVCVGTADCTQSVLSWDHSIEGPLVGGTYVVIYAEGEATVRKFSDTRGTTLLKSRRWLTRDATESVLCKFERGWLQAAAQSGHKISSSISKYMFGGVRHGDEHITTVGLVDRHSFAE
jgi:hypothetical protein